MPNFLNIFFHFSHTPTILDDIENAYDEHVPTTVDDMESSHDELRRSKRQRKEVSFGDDIHTYLIENKPSSYFEVIFSFDALLWKEAIQTELESILKNQTWESIDLPSEAKPIGYKWVFKRKYFLYGSIEKYKARLIAKGFSQKQNVDYFDTFSLVTRISSIHILIALTFYPSNEC